MTFQTFKIEIRIKDHLIKEIKKIAKRNKISLDEFLERLLKEEWLDDYIQMLLMDDIEAEKYALRKVKEEKTK